MRQFAIADTNTGEILYLNGAISGNNIFLSAPSGLGFENANKYEETEGFFIRTSAQARQGQIKGKVVFFRGAYEAYREFVDFVQKVDSLGHTLQLKYRPLEEWYNMDINIASVGKGQLNLARMLECDIKFEQLTPWYSITELRSSISGASESGIKTYSFEYSTKYPKSGAAATLTIQLDAQLPSAFECRISTTSGTISAPVITATDEEGVIIGKIDLSATGTTSALDTIEYSSVPNQSGVWLNGADIIGQLGLSSYPSFFRIPPNKNIEFEISATSLTGINVDFKFFKYYRSV